MANPEQLAILRQGPDAWNAWRKGDGAWIEIDLSEASLHNANLAGAYLSSVNLKQANLSHSNLSMADLTHAELSRADLSGASLAYSDLGSADLRRVNLREADLTFADVRTADLSEADLCEANLSETNLSATNLGGTNLSAAILGYTVFADVDLGVTKGLESVVHGGPSTIGIDTFFRSKGAIPEIFLRGAGVPDAFITYAKSLVGSAIEFYSCFISYSMKDQKFADRLYADLQAKGVRCWFAPHDVKGGRKLHEQIDEAIRLHDKLLLILSPHSMASEWVQTEISKARKREVRDKARVLFPISLASFQAIRDWESFDADTGKDSAREIREYFIPDLSNWKDHDSYQKAFERLVNDLKAPSEKASETSSGA